MENITYEKVNLGKVKGEDGEDGASIQSVEKTDTNGNVDTYTITLTNGRTFEFTVTNGTSGDLSNYVTKNELAEQGVPKVIVNNGSSDYTVEIHPDRIEFSNPWGSLIFNGTEFEFDNGKVYSLSNEEGGTIATQEWVQQNVSRGDYIKQHLISLKEAQGKNYSAYVRLNMSVYEDWLDEDWKLVWALYNLVTPYDSDFFENYDQKLIYPASGDIIHESKRFIVEGVTHTRNEDLNEAKLIAIGTYYDGSGYRQIGHFEITIANSSRTIQQTEHQ